MPLNEATIWKRSNLSKEQKLQAERDIFGLERDAMANQPVSASEIETMRRIVAEHDNQAKTTNFDLNNPPKQPYVHQDFPRVVYHHGERTHLTVQNAEELEAAIDDGYSKTPYPPEVPEAAAEPEAGEPVVSKPKKGHKKAAAGE